MKKKETKGNIKYISIIIIVLISLIIIGVTIYEKVVPIYSISDRTTTLSKKMAEDETVLGWLRVQGTNIDYPVVNSNTSKFDQGEYDYDYLWSNNSSGQVSSRMIIWGHNIRNVSSKPLINEKTFNYFENLPSFLYYDFVKENKYIQYTIGGKNHLFKIYAVSMAKKDEFSNSEYMSGNDKKDYIEKSIKESYFNFDVNVTEEDNLITLATCTRFFGDNMVIIKVDGVEVDENKKITNYKVKKNKKNYEKVEKIMKGEMENESYDESDTNNQEA